MQPNIKTRYVIFAALAALLLVAMYGAFLTWENDQPRLLECGARIEKPGTYKLESDCLSEKERGVAIEVDNVTIDLNGYGIRCLTGPRSTSTNNGIWAPERSNLVVRNGFINRCQIGINAPYANHVLIENVDFTGASAIAVALGGTGNVLRHNLFSRIGGYKEDNNYAIGINNPGSDCLIEDNTFFNIRSIPTGRETSSYEGVAILISGDTKGCTVRKNTLYNAFQRDHVYGVWMSQNSTAHIHDNTFHNYYYGIAVDTDGGVIYNNTLGLDKRLKGSIALSLRGGSAYDNRISNYDHIYENDKVPPGAKNNHAE